MLALKTFYCVAKTPYGDYIVEREDNGTTYNVEAVDFRMTLTGTLPELKLP